MMATAQSIFILNEESATVLNSDQLVIKENPDSACLKANNAGANQLFMSD